MRCMKCGAILGDPGYCSSCGKEIRIYHRLVRLSNTYYNRGLEKARVRNLSGASQDLRYSLELNKNHIQARNLLGLIYFEIGEVASALTEWIISKNLSPSKNIADEYIRAIQENPARLETINQTIKKYNQSLLYCKRGSEDLAIIQLRKVLSMNPKLVKGHQLLALLYIRTEDYGRAEVELRRALAIDRTDDISLRYQAELEKFSKKSKREGQGQERTRKKDPGKPDIISYTSGNETIIMPAAYKENTGVNVILNIFIGLVVGVALTWFLALPAKVQSVRNEANEQIREYSDQLAARQSEINELQSRLDELQSSVEIEEEETEEEDSSYELLIDAYASFQAQDTENATLYLDQIDREQLSDNALAIYNEIYASVHAEQIKELYDTGAAAYGSQEYEEAIESLAQVVEVDESYDNGYALYYLARSYETLEQYGEALELFQRFADLYPGTSRANYANEAIARLQTQVSEEDDGQTQ